MTIRDCSACRTGTISFRTGMYIRTYAAAGKRGNPDVHSRCLAHCKTGAIRLLTENPVPTQTICWRFLTEVIVPIHRGREHVATFFGGTFRLPDSQLPERGEPQDDEYWRLYRTLPEWSDSCGNEISLLLQMVGAGFLQIANRLYEEYLNQSGRAGHIRRFINYYANTDTRLKDRQNIWDFPNPEPAIC